MGNVMEKDMECFQFLSNEIDRAYHEAARKLGLTDSAMLILYTICYNGEECLLSDVTYLSGMSKQTLNSALRKLEKEGIVQSEKFQGKQKKILLTNQGKILVKNTVLPLIKIENEIFESWTKREREIYIELTERYLLAFKEKIRGLSL